MLAMELEIGLRDRVGVEAAIWTARCRTFRPRRTTYAAVDYHLSDMDILGLQLTGHALDEAAQP